MLANDADPLHAIFSVSTTGMHLTDRRGRLTRVNPAFQRLIGYTDAELLAMPLHDLVHPDDHAAFDLLWGEALAGGPETFRQELRYLRRGGQPVWVALRLTCPAASNGAEGICIGMVDDIGEAKRFERHLKYQSSHDPLTGLPNRAALQERMQRLVHTTNGEGACAFLLIGLDRLREIRDAFGQRYCDRLLQLAATRLRGVLPDDAVVARLAEDEFGALCPGNQEESAAALAEQVLRRLSMPFDLGEQSLDVDVSIGIVLHPRHGGDSKTLMQRAGIAMHEARRTRLGHAIYDEEQGARSQRRLALAGSLRRAIDYGQLILHYQPKVDFSGGEVCGVEALVRWQHPSYGLIMPGEFIPLAERTGLIKPLTRWVLDEALQQLKRLQSEQLPIRMVINLSARILHDYKLVDMVVAALQEWEVEPGSLGLEITESAVMADPHRSLVILTQLFDMGVDISIDDFGTGYSSFAYLDQVPAREIKIDRSFVRDMVSNPSHFRIVHGTIDIGHDLGLATVAEGVEDKQTLDALEALGCDIAQGFYLGHPMPGDDLPEWLREHGNAGMERATR